MAEYNVGDSLISRESAIEEFEDMVTSVSVYGESAEARYATNARIRFIEKLSNIPTVPAVPLEPLCRYLEVYARTPIYNMRHTAEWWKEELNSQKWEKWMGKQNE